MWHIATIYDIIAIVILLKSYFLFPLAGGSSPGSFFARIGFIAPVAPADFVFFLSNKKRPKGVLQGRGKDTGTKWGYVHACHLPLQNRAAAYRRELCSRNEKNKTFPMAATTEQLPFLRACPPALSARMLCNKMRKRGFVTPKKKKLF